MTAIQVDNNIFIRILENQNMTVFTKIWLKFCAMDLSSIGSLEDI